MSYVEVDVFGVYVAPIVPMMIAALAVTVALRWLAVTAGLFRWIWHPALFEASVYLIVLSAIVVVAGALRLNV